MEGNLTDSMIFHECRVERFRGLINVYTKPTAEASGDNRRHVE